MTIRKQKSDMQKLLPNELYVCVYTHIHTCTCTYKYENTHTICRYYIHTHI